jgi:phage repressor protein C with HTH and peptisase S24 domain
LVFLRIFKKMTEINMRFADIRKSTGLNKRQFADSLGINQSVAGDIELGKREPSREVMLKLATIYNVDIHWLLTGDGKQARELTTNTELNRLPVYHASELPEGAFVVPLLDQGLSAGPGSYLPEEDKAKALVHVPAYLSHYGDKIAALTVDGDSMYPTLHRGDMVICDSCGWSGEGIYALRMNGAGFVKRITQRPGKFVIISDNPKYPPQEEPEGSEDIEIIGRVHCAITRIE